ncbi:MAG: magnesium-translocating P-type ATPase [Pseudorhodoplanes sp.]|nr:magnesium-translocating P-type ATPase [Pseudorhodoplanes sp.]
MPPQTAFWSQDTASLLAALGTSLQGLPTRQAAERLRVHGRNTVEDRTETSAPRLLLQQFRSPLVLILIFGAAASLLLRDWLDAAIILAIVFGSTLLGFSQEYRASTAVAALKRHLALTVKAMREGEICKIPASDIVPGDIIFLAAGNLVPADGLVLEARDFLVTEASLTGESFPVEKRHGTLPAETAIAGRTNCVFLGTSVRSGTATVVVVETGRRTAFGDVAARLRGTPEESEFTRGIRQFGFLLVRVMIAIVLFVLTVNFVLERPAIDSLLFAVALAVGLTPELLPAIISITLSAGARAMARGGVIVRQLDAIENLGSMDILCTDKTGTLTKGVIELSDAVDPDGQSSQDVRRLAFLNATFETGIENPLDAAITAAGVPAGMRIARYDKIDEIPYDFMRKRLTIMLADRENPAQHLVVAKGAFDNVLSICSRIVRNGQDIELSEAERQRLNDYYRVQGSKGFRVLAVATRQVAAKSRYERSDETAMTFAGFLLFSDPPKPDARHVIDHLRALGIRVKIVSGDNRYVTGHLAQAIGLDARAMLTGDEIAAMRDESLWHMAERTELFVEVDPQQKERIVRALQRVGHAVGYLGDGINDAPSLHAADVGISVDQAVDVARESADIVLMQADLDVLRRGVEDGRRTFANTIKYICITTSANFGNMVSMALATPFLPFLPLAAKQILLNNFLSDFPSIAISSDNVDPDRIRSPQRWHIGDVQRFMVVFGLISSLFDILTFVALIKLFEAGQTVFQTAWFVVSLLTELAVVLVLRTRGPAWRSAPSRLLLGTTLAVCGIAIGLPYLQPFAPAFGFIALPAHLLLAMLMVATGYVVTTEIAKSWFYRGGRGP